MPSPVKGKYYKRRGGAYANTKGKKAKPGKGKYSKRDPVRDRKRRAKKGTAKQRRNYPNHYD